MTKTDWFILLVLVLSALAFAALHPLAARGRARFAQVEQGGRIIRRIVLPQDGEPLRISVDLAAKVRAVLYVREGKVRILPMPKTVCPRAICSHSGWIRRPGETLVCAPNRLVVRMIGDGAKLDAVAR
ncbi:MAG: NusG domain II-containing protein [Patescibacteria group bacterium]